MHHIYTGGKGDPLCPLGFHPQVRWPTRCKRCFRDYKEHGGKGKNQEPPLNKDDLTRSTPSLTSWSSTSSRSREDGRAGSSTFTDSRLASSESAFENESRSSNLNSNFSSNKSLSTTSSWTSTPDLGNLSEEVSTTVSVTLPRRRTPSNVPKIVETSNKPTEFTIRRRANTMDLTQVNVQNGSLTNEKPKTTVEISEGKPKVKTSTSTNTTHSIVLGKPHLKKSAEEPKKSNGKPPGKLKKSETEANHKENQVSPDVEFILKVKSSKPEAAKKGTGIVKQTSSVLIPPHNSSSSSSSGPEDSVGEDEDDNGSTVCTETTETTLIGKNDLELLEEVESLRNELEAMKTRCERVEREKSDILLRRLASLDTTSTKTAASEVLKLQQKVNEVSTQLEDLKDDKKSLTLRVKELEKELEEQKRSSNASKMVEELQGKLSAAETLCEELMDENEEVKKELRELEDEIEEMRDNFREDQADEYLSLKKELGQTTKNCRILSFKLRKSERKAEELESEKLETEIKYKEILDQKGVNSVDKIKKLEGDLKVANELATRLTKELEETNKRLKTYENQKDSSKTLKTTSPNTLKPSGGEKVSRASLTRGGSQEDPQQLLRDLQDCLEREADLREQLKFAEEEAANLRKKAARVEEDNDSLALQLKKMATKAKTSRRSSPSTNNRTTKPAIEKDEGISDEEDPAELRVLLELNEQESAILRKKVEELETDSEAHKKKIKQLEEKLALVSTTKKFGSVGALGANASLLDKEKIKVAEEEVMELRKKVIEKEREIERLESEIHLSHKKTTRGTLSKSQSLDSPTEQKALDLKRQLQLVEQEAAVLRTKITTLEADNEKLSAENKKLQLLRVTKKAVGSTEGTTNDKIANLELKLSNSDKQVKELKAKLEKYESADEKASPAFKISEMEKLKKELKAKADEVEKLEKEKKSVKETLKRLREDATTDVLEYYKSRKPKKPTDLTTKLQLKKMVEDLENEIADVLVVLKKSESQKTTVKPDSQSDKKNVNVAEIEKETELEIKKLKENLSELEKEKETWKSEKKNFEEEIKKLNAEKKNSALAQDEVSVFAKKVENANKQLEEEKINSIKLNKKLESLEEVEKKNIQLQKDVSNKSKEMENLEKKLTEVEEKLKKAEKNLSVSRGKVSKLEKNVEELEEIKNGKEKKCQTMEDELSEVKTSNSLLNEKIADLEKEIRKSKDVIKNLEESIRKEREKAVDECLKIGSVEKKEITALREDLSIKSKQLEEVSEKLEKVEKAKKGLEENFKKTETEITKEKNQWESKASDLETDLNAERKKAERMRIAHEKEQKNREMELSELKSKIATLEQTTGMYNKKISGMKDEWTLKIQKLENKLEEEKRKYEDLTTKYELLEEEHVVTKAQLVMEKEQAQNQLGTNKKEITTLELEVKNLQDILQNKQEAWKKEKKELQEKVKGNLEKAAKLSEAKWDLEKAKLMALNEEQKSAVEKFKQENESMIEQMDHMRKENEELRKKLEDFNKVSKIQRQISAESQQLESQLRDIREKLTAEEKNHKSEMAALKLRYESRVNLISGELQTSQNHLSRFKRERDNYKHMLEEAQAKMAELKKGNPADDSDETKDGKTSVAALEQQVSCMEDELSEARLECSKLRTELVSERSACEVKLSELRSKVNELEEEKILSSGRTKVAGLRTKMELAWQKEREDQQRLLQETSALARDLRQTLYEVERERDKIKLESKRIQEQIKRVAEEEMEDNHKKIAELQCDLLELRDAHAKLRTTNEKLRREKEKWDRENKSLQRSKIKTEEEERKIQLLLDNIDLLLKKSFEKKSSGKFLDSSTKKRAGSRSRESSPLTTALATPQDEISLILQRLSETAEEIRARSQSNERAAEDRSKRASSVGYTSLRAASAESETGSDFSAVTRRPVQIHRKGTLHRKSLSLSETAERGALDQAIWRDDDNDVSLTSLDDHTSSRFKSLGYRENSMDSRLSGGSTQSEVVRGDKKKKKGIFGKLKKLTKTKSVDDPTSSQEDIMTRDGGSDSDVSGTGDLKGSKKDLMGKLADMFKKDSARNSSGSSLKISEERKSQTLPLHGSGGSSTSSSTMTTTSGRRLDKAKNPAASLIHKH